VSQKEGEAKGGRRCRLSLPNPMTTLARLCCSSRLCGSATLGFLEVAAVTLPANARGSSGSSTSDELAPARAWGNGVL
jgi:hypothetical protein